MSSFYGGKQGRTYNIVQRYDSVAAMVTLFAKGGAYTGANYGEYVIIDTVGTSEGRSGIENGLLYRRGFDYNDSAANHPKPTVESYTLDNVFDLIAYKAAFTEWAKNPGAGAIYIGQIVGPEGRSPKITIENWSDYTNQVGSTAYSGWYNSSTLTSRPGKEDENTFNDVIKSGYVNIKDEHGDITGGYIAFDIPYTVLEATIDNNPYHSASVVENAASTAHPFYYKWDFTIPGGKHGAEVTEMVKETGESIIQDPDMEENPVDAEGNSIVDEYEYITYTWKEYLETAEGASTAHLGRWPYRVINNINTNFKERLYFNWASSTYANIGEIYPFQFYPLTLEPELDYSDNENLNEELEIVTVEPEPLKDNDGNLICAVCIFAGLTNPEEIPSPAPSGSTERYVIGYLFDQIVTGEDAARWRVIKLPETAPAVSLTVNYKAGLSNTISPIRNLDYITIDKVGNLFAYYSDLENPYYLSTLRMLEEIYFQNDELASQIVIKYEGLDTPNEVPLKSIRLINLENCLLTITTKEGNLNGEYTFSFPTLLQYNALTGRGGILYVNQENITQSQYFVANWANSETTQVSKPINTVLSIERLGDNIIVLYSDPDVRAEIAASTVRNSVIVPSWKDLNTGSTYENLVWLNLGPLGAQYHVQGEYHYADLKGDTLYVDYNANTYVDLSSGFTGNLEDRAGWLVTVTSAPSLPNLNDGIKHLYAYDYNDKNPDGSYIIGYNSSSTFTSHWYEILSLTSSMIDPGLSVLVSPIDSASTVAKPSLDDNLRSGGLWFITSGGHDE